MPHLTHKNSIYRLVVWRETHKTTSRIEWQNQQDIYRSIYIKANSFKDFNLVSLLTLGSWEHATSDMHRVRTPRTTKLGHNHQARGSRLAFQGASPTNSTTARSGLSIHEKPIAGWRHGSTTHRTLAKFLAKLAISAHHVATGDENHCWTMFMANGASDTSTTGTLLPLLRWFLGAVDISHRPCSTHAEMIWNPSTTYQLHASITESQLHQHGPQLPHCDIPSSSPLLDLFTQVHWHLALVLLILGCLPAFLLEPLLLCGNQRINQALRFAPSLCGGLAQLLKEGHGFESTRIFWPCKSGRKALSQKQHITHVHRYSVTAQA